MSKKNKKTKEIKSKSKSKSTKNNIESKIKRRIKDIDSEIEHYLKEMKESPNKDNLDNILEIQRKIRTLDAERVEQKTALINLKLEDKIAKMRKNAEKEIARYQELN